MKQIALFLLTAVLAAAQGTLSLTNTGTPPTAGYAAGTVIPLVISATGNTTCGTNNAGCITAAQFTVSASAGSIVMTVPTGIAGSKQLACSATSPYVCLLVGLTNDTPIPAGTIAVATITLPSPAPTGPVTVTLSSAIEADGLGNSLAVTIANPTVSLSIQNRCAVTGDSSPSSADTSAVISEALTGQTTAATDVNSDGKTNVLDAQIVATAAAGGACNSK